MYTSTFEVRSRRRERCCSITLPFICSRFQLDRSIHPVTGSSPRSLEALLYRVAPTDAALCVETCTTRNQPATGGGICSLPVWPTPTLYEVMPRSSLKHAIAPRTPAFCATWGSLCISISTATGAPCLFRLNPCTACCLPTTNLGPPRVGQGQCGASLPDTAKILLHLNLISPGSPGARRMVLIATPRPRQLARPDRGPRSASISAARRGHAARAMSRRVHLPT